MPLPMPPRDLFLFMMIVLTWGLNFVAVKLGTDQFPPIFMTFLRFIIVSLVLVPFVPRPKGNWLKLLALSFTMGTLHFSLVFTGISGVDASTAAIAVQMQVPFAAILASIFFKDRLGWRRILGMVIAFCGVAVMAGEPRLGDQYGSLALVLGAAMAFAVSSVQMKKTQGISGWTITAWISLLALPQLLIVTWVLEDGQMASLQSADLTGWGALLFTALGSTLIGHGLWARMVTRYDINQAAPFTLMVPVVGAASGIVFLHEPLTIPFLIGGILTLAGVGIIILRRPGLGAPVRERL
ncbi:DMT family transporter [Fodinicurvata sediminis]|uniref:DMT family transporter n=1 Tax=Fodinicurvata sediminis TaxID=1121832 RepID=UPI0003B681D1|nr:EamA family transporter [Fodinicurvata sediminis]